MMEPIAIQLKEKITVPRAGEPLRFGVPLPNGAVKDVSQLQLSSPDNALWPTQSRPLALWADGTVRWVCVETLLPITGNPPTDLTLLEGSNKRQNSARITQFGDQLQISYGDYQLTANHGSLNWQWAGPDDQSFFSRLRLDDRENKACLAKLDEHWQIKSTGPVVTVLAATGWWHDSQKDRLARFRCELAFYASGLVNAEAVIHNPRRARHSGGLWDLGDPGSIHFGAMAVETDTTGSEQYLLTLSPDQPPRKFDADQPLSLHQESSGGENWNSRNHINAEGQVLPRYRGYRLHHGHKEPENGLRAEPVIEARTAVSRISISLPHFWQNFPSALEANDTTLRAWLFPDDKAEAYELQGGERKTQRVVLGYGLPLEQLSWCHSPLVPVLSPEHYQAADAFPWFNPAAKNDRLQLLIQKGIDGSRSFFHKREIIDEYGWRNFGDLFADHETLYQQSDEQPFISHYNNQYDPIYGFARQFALTGDPRWQELMGDLAHHVTDIDIYHTDEDRVEYNNGLFWHTDHYLDAHTATHRTFSKYNSTSSTPGQTGGGPAAEHCYTTGLLYHYYLTGNEGSRTAVLDLAGWIKTVHEGQGGLLEQILALKKHEIPNFKRMLQGERPPSHQYPFTRGTGNYINTLLDAWLLDANGGWMELAERVIQGTIHPADNLEGRNLLDVETGWSYLVLLASLARYLYLKRKLHEQDTAYYFAQASLLHYTRWMRQKEEPFLSDPTQLEFANDTWVAQDIRKSMLMFQAAEINPQEASEYREKAQEWLRYTVSTLQSSNERHFSRILVILMQNHGPHEGCTQDQQEQSDLVSTKQLNYASPTLTWKALMTRITKRIFRGLLNFSPSRERLWLNARLDRPQI